MVSINQKISPPGTEHNEQMTLYVNSIAISVFDFKAFESAIIWVISERKSNAIMLQLLHVCFSFEKYVFALLRFTVISLSFFMFSSSHVFREFLCSQKHNFKYQSR